MNKVLHYEYSINESVGLWASNEASISFKFYAPMRVNERFLKLFALGLEANASNFSEAIMGIVFSSTCNDCGLLYGERYFVNDYRGTFFEFKNSKPFDELKESLLEKHERVLTATPEIVSFFYSGKNDAQPYLRFAKLDKIYADRLVGLTFEGHRTFLFENIKPISSTLEPEAYLSEIILTVEPYGSGTKFSLQANVN